MCSIYDILSHFMMFCCKIVMYAVLSRYLFCRDLRAFAWRKIQPKIAPRGEKMTNMRYDNTPSYIINRRLKHYHHAHGRHIMTQLTKKM